MHDIKSIRDDPDAFDKGLKRRGLEPASRNLLALDEQVRALKTKVQLCQEERNKISKQIGEVKKAKGNADALMAEVNALKEAMVADEAAQAIAEKDLNDELAGLPNIPADDVPEGADEKGNVERHKVGSPRKFDFTPKQHFEIGEALGLMDFETAAKISGARFGIIKGALAKLERALGQFMLDLHVSEHGYTEVNPPLLVHNGTMFGTAQLPKFADDQFRASRKLNTVEINEVFLRLRREDFNFNKEEETSEYFETIDVGNGPVDVFTDEGLKKFQELQEYFGGLWLIPTSEVPLTNLVRESIQAEKELPLRYTAFTPCFRAEAGAAGRDTRGMIRQHQFMKVELVSITTPEQSEAEHERMLGCAEEVLKQLKLPFRTVTLCTGDMGFAAKKTYDIEVWLPGQDAYREISSCSNCGDFQARRMKARYKTADGKGPHLLHTLNGSGVAVGRCLVAILENYQNKDGSVSIPEVLHKYMGMTEIRKS
jgi:seryl-tRNA synthetase